MSVRQIWTLNSHKKITRHACQKACSHILSRARVIIACKEDSSMSSSCLPPALSFHRLMVLLSLSISGSEFCAHHPRSRSGMKSREPPRQMLTGTAHKNLPALPAVVAHASRIC